MKHLLLLLSASLVLVSCSSTPREPDEIRVTRNRAAQFAEYGNTAFDRADYSQARAFFEIALALNTSVDERDGMADMHNSIGRTWQAQGDFDTASDHYATARRMSERTGNARIEALAINNQGELSLQQGNAEQARTMFETALEKLDTVGNVDSDRAIVLHNLGSAHASAGRLDDARVILGEAEEVNRRLNRRRELAANLFMRASVESRSGNLEQAFAYASEALELDRAMENPRGIAADLYALGRISFRMNRNEDALDYLSRSLAVHESISAPRGMIRALQALEEVATATGDDVAATDYARRRETLESASGDSR